MLRTNSKQARENLKAYITANMCHYDESPAIDWEDARETLKRHFTGEKMHKYNRVRIAQGKETHYNIFRDWMQGLPLGGIGDYFYHMTAKEILGGILEESEQEKACFTEEAAESKLTQLIYNIIF